MKLSMAMRVDYRAGEPIGRALGFLGNEGPPFRDPKSLAALALSCELVRRDINVWGRFNAVAQDTANGQYYLVRIENDN